VAAGDSAVDVSAQYIMDMLPLGLWVEDLTAHAETQYIRFKPIGGDFLNHVLPSLLVVVMVH
jgi:hypothetical protein